MLRQLAAQPRRCCAISARAAATTRHPARRHGRAGTRPAGAARRGPAPAGGAAHAGAGAGRRRGSGRAAGHDRRGAAGVALRWHARRPSAAAIGPCSGAPGTSATSRSAWPASEPDMNGRARNAAIGARLPRRRPLRSACPGQRAARRLAEDIARLDLPPRPRILEIGCGTGLLTRELARRLGPADWTLTDISPAMLEIARLGPAPQCATRRWTGTSRRPARRLRPHLLQPGGAVVRRPERGLGRLAALLAPGGHLAIATLAEDTFAEWRTAHARAGLDAGTRLSRARRHPSGHGQSGRCRARRTAGTTAS